MHKIHQPTIQQLRLFEAVTRLGSITAAAKEASLSQPSVSMQVKALEDKIGMALTENRGKAIHLTRAGEEVAKTARMMMSQLSEMETRLLDLHGGVAGPLSIAVVSTAKYFLPQLIGAFRREFPKTEPQLIIANREVLLSRIADRADDIYIMGQLPDDNEMDAAPFMENVISFIAPRDHHLARRQLVSLDEIATQAMIGREAGSGTRKAVEGVFREAGHGLQPIMAFDDSEAIKQAVISGLGIAYVSHHALRLELAAGELVTLNVENFPIRRRWYAIHDPHQIQSNAVKQFLEFLAAQKPNDDR